MRSTKSEVNKKAHLLNEYIKIRNKVKDPNILDQIPVKDYDELVQQILPKKMEEDRKNAE